MSKIKTYQDLLEEEQILKGRLKASEILIREDIMRVKQRLRPLGKVVSTFEKFTTRDKTGAFTNLGLDFSVDVLIRRFLLAKAGWITRILVPYVIKNYFSHLINEQQRGMILKKINGFLSKIRQKIKPTEAKM